MSRAKCAALRRVVATALQGNSDPTAKDKGPAVPLQDTSIDGGVTRHRLNSGSSGPETTPEISIEHMFSFGVDDAVNEIFGAAVPAARCLGTRGKHSGRKTHREHS